MVIRSRLHFTVPSCSLQQWIFGSSQGSLDNTKPLYLDADRPATHFLTKADYRLLAKRIAVGLIDAGLRPGERVLVFSGNSIYYPPLFLGVLMAGGIFSGANPSFVARELTYQLRDADASFLLVAAGSLSTALDAAKAVGLSRDRIYVLDEAEDMPSRIADTNVPAIPASAGTGLVATGGSAVHHWLELVAGNRHRALTWDWTEPREPAATTCCLNYSSGTTGLPKGVAISHDAYVANCSGVVAMGSDDPEWTAQRRRAVELGFLPLYHAFGQTYFVANFAKMDIPMYLMPRFDFVKMLQHIQAYHITSLTLVPPIAVALAKHPLVKQYDLSSVETAGCGAAPLAHESAVGVERLWPAGRVTMRQGWGMTEVTCTCMGWAPDTEASPGPSVGELMPNCAARLAEVDDDSTGNSSMRPRYITKAHTRGELWVTGPTLMQGYWRNQKATQDTMHVDADGTRWLKTGDIAYVDRYADGGTFFIVERRKELIKVKGHQVAPAELEAILLERPDVVDVAVIGVSVDGQERPRAYVVRVPGSSLSGTEIEQWMASRVTPYKRLVGGVVFVDAIPKNPSGKILRKVLRDRAAKEPHAPQRAKL